MTDLNPAGLDAAAAAFAAIRDRDARRTVSDLSEPAEEFDTRRAAEIVAAYLDATPAQRRQSLTGGNT